MKTLTKIGLSTREEILWLSTKMKIWLEKTFLAALVIVELCVLGGFFLWDKDSRSHLNAYRESSEILNARQSALESKIRQQLAYRDALSNDRDFVESVARDKLGYAQSDEFVFLISE